MYPARSWPTAAGVIANYSLTLISAHSEEVIYIAALQYGLQLKLLYLARASPLANDQSHSRQGAHFTPEGLICKRKVQSAELWMGRGDLELGGHPLWSPLLGVNTEGHGLVQWQGGNSDTLIPRLSWHGKCLWGVCSLQCGEGVHPKLAGWHWNPILASLWERCCREKGSQRRRWPKSQEEQGKAPTSGRRGVFPTKWHFL